jgi:hypothetical protein
MPSNNANAQRKAKLLKIAEGVRNGTIERKPPKPTDEDLIKMEAIKLEKKEKARADALKKQREREERKKKLANAEQYFEEAAAAGLLGKKPSKFITTLSTKKHMNTSGTVSNTHVKRVKS